MPTLKLTKASVERLKAPDPSHKQVLHWDADLKGFGVLCSGVTSKKTYVVQGNLPDGRTRRITVGDVAKIDLADARSRALKLFVEFAGGVDPKAERKKAVLKAITLRAALDAYLKAQLDKDKIRPESAKEYRAVIERHLADWLDRPLREIDSDMVEDRHHRIQASIEARNRPRAHFQSRPGAHMANATFRIFGILWNYITEREIDSDLPRNPVRRLRGQWYEEPSTRTARPHRPNA